MENEFNKIVIVSNEVAVAQSVGKALSQKLGMLFCDAKELLEYELIDVDSMKEIVSKEYVDKCEKKVFKRIASFVNVVVSIDFNSFIHNHEVLKKGGLCVFLAVPKSKVTNPIENMVWQQHKSQLEKLCTLTLNIRKIDDDHICEKIIKMLGGIV